MKATQVMSFDDGPRSKRRAILDAAVQSFGEVGYEATKWSSVADVVGIGQTALYHYFESKAHCLLTIMRVELERSHERFLEATADASDSIGELRLATAAAFSVTSAEIKQLRILQSNFSILANERSSAAEEAERQGCRAMMHQVEEDWTALLQRGVDRGEFRPQDTRLSAQVLLGTIVSVWRWYRPEGSVSLDDLSAFVSDGLTRMLVTD